MAVSKPLLTEFGFHHRLESCDRFLADSASYAVVRTIFGISTKTRELLVFPYEGSLINRLQFFYLSGPPNI